ncbi:epoxide hydrolase family protein [Paenibacillus lignilyticus]|uniref:Epoxide hydrolase N-terminal domain-containing protein n=1 Tax=Paenibacillus lignilyticus TaxID=1172615 RepID=A0ABS5CBU4_9BACL|nr:epoxide hydrolase [Paenibacillus lignilyticus]MBP3963192.1 epoxide hydrolase N-terminal domain-containing protein [Paenibacillus lignilyticus]
MAQGNANQQYVALTSTDKKAIRGPFQIHFPEAELTELQKRIIATRWPEKETVSNQTQGVPLATMQKVAEYWATEYDWRKCEAMLNNIPQFLTEIDGLDIHFMHIRSKHEDALPMIITHGWSGSIIELLKIIDPLTNPTAYGAKASDAFHLVIPSLPGYGFSGKPASTGWGPVRIAQAWIELMNRLGYSKYVAQGGDWGAIVTDFMGVMKPPGLLGMHTNMPGTVPPDIDTALMKGNPLPSNLTPEEMRACEQLAFVYRHIAYASMMGTRPQTLTGLMDSPIGLAAFLMDHDACSLELMIKAFDGHPEGLTRDNILDNATLYWLTKTAISAARLYWENMFSFFVVKGVQIPAAVTVFPYELYEAPKSWTRQAYPELIYYNRVDRGGHFAAWEVPLLFSEEVRAGLRPLRE